MAMKFTGNLSNFTEPGQLVIKMNERLGNWLGASIILSVFFILWITGLRVSGSPKQATTGAFFISTILAYLLWLVSMANVMWFIIGIIGTTASLVWLYVPKD